jgi:hypothetical protein
MRSLTWGSSVTAIAAVLSMGPAHATTYTLGQGFSSQGPIWYYGSVALGAPYPDYVTSFLGNPSIQAWADTSQPQYSQYGTPSVFYNSTASGVTLVNTVYLPAGQVAFHPGANGEDSTVLFVAPTSGDYNVTASFTGLDFVGPTDTAVYVDFQQVGIVAGYDGGGSNTTSGPNPVVTWTGSGYLAAGEPLAFSVAFDPSNLSGRGTGPFYYDTTGISVSVSTPEPSTWALMALGFAGLGFAGFRQARRSAGVASA